MPFSERCDQAGVPRPNKCNAFLIMAAGIVRQFYLNNLMKQNVDRLTLPKSTNGRFQTPERTKAILFECDTLVLDNVMKTSSEKHH